MTDQEHTLSLLGGAVNQRRAPEAIQLRGYTISLWPFSEEARLRVLADVYQRLMQEYDHAET